MIWRKKKHSDKALLIGFVKVGTDSCTTYLNPGQPTVVRVLSIKKVKPGMTNTSVAGNIVLDKIFYVFVPADPNFMSDQL